MSVQPVPNPLSFNRPSYYSDQNYWSDFKSVKWTATPGIEGLPEGDQARAHVAESLAANILQAERYYLFMNSPYMSARLDF